MCFFLEWKAAQDNGHPPRDTEESALDQTDNPVEGLMDIEAVSRALGVSKKYVYANHKVDGPPALKIGSLLRWRRDDVQRWIESKATGSGLQTPTFHGAAR